MAYTEKSLDTGELALNYVEASRSGPPLLLLHGLTGRWRAWELFMPHLTPAWHVVAYDLRGHGKSGKVAGQYHLVDYAKDTVALAGALFTERVVLMGHSLGALTAIAAAAQAPERVRGAVLLDPPLFIRNASVTAMPGAHFWFSFVNETLKAKPSYAEVAARCRALSPDADQAVIKDQADSVYSLDVDTVGIALQGQTLAGWDLEAALQRISCPTLLMRGDWGHGAAVRDEDAAYVKAHLPHVTDVKMPDGTHGFPWEQFDATLRQVRTFLQSV